jgi:hypothetical protein
MQVEFIHLFNNEMHTKLGHPLGYQLRKEQHDTVLYSVNDAEKRKKSRSQHSP